MSKATQYCSFCSSSQDDVRKLIAAETVAICNDCVALCADICRGFPLRFQPEEDPVPAPDEIRDVLDGFLQGQGLAKRALSAALHRHFRCWAAASQDAGPVLAPMNLLLCGPASQRGEVLNALRQGLEAPVAVLDIAALLEIGAVSEVQPRIVEELLEAASYNVQTAQHRLLFIDDIDQLGRRGPSGEVEEPRVGIQKAIAGLLRGAAVEVPVAAGGALTVGTSAITFVFGGFPPSGGASPPLRDGRHPLDWQAGGTEPAEGTLGLSERETEALADLGLIPELLEGLSALVVLESRSDAA